MKKFYYAILALAACALAGGCTSTGMVSVDRNAAQWSGLEITEFTDNPIFAYIHYDYSEIEDFDEKNVKVRLDYIEPEDKFDAINLYNEVLEIIDPIWREMKLASCDHGTKWIHWVERDATIVSRKPGYLKILALDDIGRYTVVYDASSRKSDVKR